MSGSRIRSFLGKKDSAKSFSLGGSQNGKSLQLLLLHGSLDVWIFEAKNLPNVDGLSDRFSRLLPSGVRNKNIDICDPYVSISVSNAVVGRTYVITNNENPVWMQHFNVPVAHYASKVLFIVKDDDVVGSQRIGTVAIPADQICSREKVEGWFPILNSNGNPSKEGATLRLSIQVISIEKQTMYQNGVGRGPNYDGVAGTYFPLRRGGKVTLYQDAHIPEGCLPDLKIDQGTPYEHEKCWHDIFEAISQARHLIYITGWSLYHKIRLVRDGHGSDCTLGDLLKTKSQEGVTVLLLLWDDPTSRNFLICKTSGYMKTHDEETRRFFNHSSVKVLLRPRSGKKK